jgi:hypothetical protein
MKWLARIFGLLLLLVVSVLVIGFTLPAHHILTRTITLKRSPDAVFAVLADLPNMPTWNHALKKVKMLPPIDGKEASQQTLEGNMTMTIVTSESVFPSRLVRTIADPTAPFSGGWTYDISATADGSRVALTEDSTVPNPIFRLLVKFSGPAKFLDEHLVDLGKHFGETVTPQ